MEPSSLGLTEKSITTALWQRGSLEYKLHHGQRELRHWWQNNNNRVSVLNIARRYGKSTLLVTLALEHAINTPNGRVIFAAPTREQARDIVAPIFRDVLVDCPTSLRPRYNESRNYFTFENGCEIHVDGADDERGARLRGTKATLALFDECGFSRWPVEVVKGVLLPQTITCNGRILIASTPSESPHHPWWELVAEARLNNAYITRTIYQNPLVTPALIEEYMRESGGENASAWRREYLCERVAEVERAVVPEFKPHLHVGEMAQPEFFDSYVWIDLGMVDLTHALFAHYNFDKATIVVEDEIVRQYKTVSELAPEISAKEKQLWPGQEPRARISDNHPMEIAEFHRQHILQPHLVTGELKFAAANNRNPDALINRVRSMFAFNRIMIHPRCVGLIAQLEGGLYNANRTDFEKIKGLGHMDGLLALSYGVDTIDYVTNPNLRKKLNPEHFATYLQKSKTDQRYGKLANLLNPATRKH